MEIPKFLLEMSKQMNEQENRITADPIWMVCYDKELVTEAGYNESHKVYFSDEDGKICDDSDLIELAEYIEENHEDWFNKYLSDNGLTDYDETLQAFVDNFDFEYESLPKGIKCMAAQKNMEVVKACLTESDANWFIQRKQHDYPKLYTYVFSMHHCPQMIELRNWILSLASPEDTPELFTGTHDALDKLSIRSE